VKLYERIRDLVIAARQTIARGVDLVQVHTNFQIGRHIVEHEQQGERRATYGRAGIKALAEKLTREFGRGFSKSNIEYMRRFYLFYQERASIAQPGTGQFPDTALSAALRHEQAIAQFETGQSPFRAAQPPQFILSWTHYVFLMGIGNADEKK
jgi:hypothetical protein